MLEADVLSEESPWPGMRPYREADTHFFFGRDSEIADLLARTNRSLLTLLYGRAGLGKTSLVRAGLAPRLMARGLFPVYLRPRALLENGSDPVAGVIRAVADAAKQHDVEATGSFEAPSLWELFHRESFDFWDANNRLVAPVLVFDQFEEVFQLLDEKGAPVAKIKILLNSISELVENRVPARLAAMMELPNSAEFRFNMSAADYRVILSFREDYLPHVRQLRAIVPSVIENHLRLEPLDGEQARDVVQGAGKALVDAKAAELLVRSVARQAGLLQLLLGNSARVNAGDESSLSGLVVEPAILSVVCFYLNTERQRRRQQTIDVSLVNLKKPEDIFDEYYRWAIADSGSSVRRFVETALVTKDGQRVLYPVTALESQSAATKGGVDKLVARGVLRREWFGGEERLEVSHDLMLRPIIEAQREAQRAHERKRLFTRVATVFVGLLLAAAWIVYEAWQRVETIRDLREASMEATLGLMMPAPDDDKVVEGFYLLHNAAKKPSPDQIAASLYELLELAVKNARSSTRRDLPTLAATYAELEIDRHSDGSAPYDGLVAKVRDIVATACREVRTLPGDPAVQWFKDHGGIPAECT